MTTDEAIRHLDGISADANRFNAEDEEAVRVLVAAVRERRPGSCRSCARWRPTNDMGTRGVCGKYQAVVPVEHGCLGWEPPAQ